ncbi:hypothetical protein ANRL1_03394 [Anaerolineae bacterium]|nr:hypothetical protein ANRL1_03394 [Anaerolineae bacterium]
MPNSAAQFLLADSVRVIGAELATRQVPNVDCVSLDTKHIIAWVKENNLKTYVKNRYDKTQQPRGDPDCRLGCKRKHNRTTRARNGIAGSTVPVGEYYWGYGSGAVVAKVPGWGEFVVAEMTQPFDQGDTTYFFPLMSQVDLRLGDRPRYATFDAATDRTKCIIEHERGKYVCPLRFPTQTQRACPVRHRNWSRGGCTAEMPTSIGARLCYTLDRASERYKAIYNQRTAVERINAQAVALGVERPPLRNGRAIANQNTLIYTLINLRFLQRVRAGRREND